VLLSVALISDPDVYSHDFDLYHLSCVLFFGVCFRIGTAAKSDARTAAETPAYSPGTDTQTHASVGSRRQYFAINGSKFDQGTSRATHDNIALYTYTSASSHIAVTEFGHVITGWPLDHDNVLDYSPRTDT
jgi:hypothetical protein